MTEPEDQLRAYAAAVERAQRPVDIGEVTSRRRFARVPLVRVAAALVAVIVVAGAVIVVTRGHGGPSSVVVSPGATTTAPARTTPTTPADCPVASLVVTSTRGETLHPGWLPPGFVLTQGNESDLGQIGDVEYSTPGGGDRPRVELLRYNSTQPLAHLYLGTAQPTTVQGHAGILSVGTPMAEYTALLWRPSPGVALVVNGYNLTGADLRKIAENVHYEAGAEFTYPAHPTVTVSREQALAALGGTNDNKAAVLSSLGEISAVAASGARTGVRVDLAPGVPVTEPVWVVWDRAGSPPFRAVVVDAQSGDTLATISRIGSRPLDALTDRSQPVCAPPFGVLTRSEATFVEQPAAGVTTIMKLATQGTIASFEHNDLLQCGTPSTCDPTVPIWLVIQIASDHRFTDEESGPPGRPKITTPGSFSVTMFDARTGPQNTNFGGELGAGRPPRSQLDIPDLEP